MISTSELPEYQPQFLPTKFRTHLTRLEAGRELLAKLHAMQREFAADKDIPAEWLDRIDEAVADIAAWFTFNDLHLEKLVLFAVEDLHLYLITEIADEFCIDRRFVVEIVKRLERRGLLYTVRRLVPQSGRPQTMIKSSRAANVEASFSFADSYARDSFTCRV